MREGTALSPVALDAEIHGGIQGKVLREIGAVQFMTTEAGQRGVGALIDDVRTDRV